MENKQKALIIVIVLILMATSFLAIYLSLQNEEVKEPIVETPSIETKEEINDEIIVLETEKMYFNLEKTINDYYAKLVSNNKDVYDILEDSYKNEYNITEYNVIDKIGLDLNNATYVLKKVYCNNDSTITYYFINGYLYTQYIDEGELEYSKDVNFLIIEKDNKYVIRPIDSSLSLENYANSYNIVDIKLQSNAAISNPNISEKVKLSKYINEFKNLLYLDTTRAYDMLTEETKAKYLSYEDFYNNVETIYNSLSTNIFAYGIKEEESYKVYSAQDMNQKSIKIIEYKPKDFKIGY